MKNISLAIGGFRPRTNTTSAKSSPLCNSAIHMLGVDYLFSLGYIMTSSKAKLV
jgi:hypothetical protein